MSDLLGSRIGEGGLGLVMFDPLVDAIEKSPFLHVTEAREFTPILGTGFCWTEKALQKKREARWAMLSTATGTSFLVVL